IGVNRCLGLVGGGEIGLRFAYIDRGWHRYLQVNRRQGLVDGIDSVLCDRAVVFWGGRIKLKLGVVLVDLGVVGVDLRLIARPPRTGVQVVEVGRSLLAAETIDLRLRQRLTARLEPYVLLQN